ncbi:DUF6493 family protein [Solirubrobacter taibaiensis]|nr:DUF6493 family protein [Solirubrobacter taibaiensis]
MPGLTERSSALFDAIVRADRAAVVATLHDWTEDERRAVVPTLRAAVRAETRGWTIAPDGRLVATGHHTDDWYEQFHALNLAVLGTYPLTALRAYPWALSEDPLVGAVLLDRRPSWLAAFADWALLTEPRSWPGVRALIRAGAIARPPLPLYLSGLVLTGQDGEIARLVEDDPELLARELWELLATDTGQQSLRAADAPDPWDQGYEWTAFYCACVADGRLERARVLDTILDGLAGDMIAYRAAWHTKLWKELVPTRPEVAERVERLRVLLGAAAAPVVAFAVKELVRARATVPPAELSAALTAASKTTVRGALKLLDDAPAAAALALGHPAADIQSEVLDRLERRDLDDAARTTLLGHLDLLAATQRPRAEALLNLKGPGPFISAPTVDLDAIPEPIRVALNFGGPLPSAPVPGEPVLGDRVDSEEGPLVSRPTHAGGWIEPSTLVERLRTASPSENAFAQALLRLAPEGRDPALAAGLTGRTGAVLRCALGGDPVPDDGPAAAAARAVAGVTPISVNVTLDLDDVRPIDWLVTSHDGPTGAGPLADHLATLDADDGERWHRRADPLAFPARRDIAAAGAINRLGWNLDAGWTQPTGTPELLGVLLSEREPLAPLTVRFIVLALASAVAEEHLLAADLLIAAIDDGRLDAAALEPSRVDLPVIKPNRLAARLQTVAETGPLQRAVVRDFLDATVDAVTARPGPLLVLFDELCAQTDTGPARSREYLRTLSHKAAKSLVKREGDPPAAEAQLALAARVRRARRWMAA